MPSDKAIYGFTNRRIDGFRNSSIRKLVNSSILLVSLLFAGCATTGAVRAGERAELAQDYDRAVIEYTRALQADPDVVLVALGTSV